MTGLCEVCGTPAIECQTSAHQFCLTCAYAQAEKLGISVESANHERGEALVTQSENPIATIQWYMGNVTVRDSGDIDRIPDPARPYVQDQMRAIQSDLARMERSTA